MNQAGGPHANPLAVPQIAAAVWSRVRDALTDLDAEVAPDFLRRAAIIESSDGESVEALATLLMEGFARTRNLSVYSMLYEISHRQILFVILKRTRFTHPGIDPKDVLQDVFLSIYRYPHRFRNEKASSFRNWSFSIVRNTLLKHLRASRRPESELEPIEDLIADERSLGPLQELTRDEDALVASRSYALCLMAYGRAFDRGLRDREKRALQLIEVQGMKYRKAADRLGVRVENLKMIVCRARKKLLRTMADLLEVQRND